MSKQLALACLYMGKGYGCKAYQYDMEDSTDYADDRVIAKLLVRWAAFAVELVELAHSVTMEYPDSHEHEIYGDFGNWFGEECSNNNEHTPPPEEACKEQIIELVMAEYSDILNESQQARLLEQFNAVNP